MSELHLAIDQDQQFTPACINPKRSLSLLVFTKKAHVTGTENIDSQNMLVQRYKLFHSGCVAFRDDVNDCLLVNINNEEQLLHLQAFMAHVPEYTNMSIRRFKGPVQKTSIRFGPEDEVIVYGQTVFLFCFEEK
ncbi:hypothetical protein RCL1_005977 [Eukaryota sp. TZLM3-RCL]